ncbi:hypothetical protein [Flavobacterium cellulosilyticum]|uniref:Uncharacterized protein n=1 Tax=Flavobacterium cellulosilyticum TaxID=2541731 RepID=A0A4R5CDJ2_9FLAO|nr:hypothetical protein [Flavobacterium cellulosilyticum]TDD96989.1 hypothetical protein E0F76_10140 [Flavobacterium cellulosilyticum]
MNQKHQEDLSHIRSMMERSSRFISLSGLSGVFAGISALLGGGYAFQLAKDNGINLLDGTNDVYRPELIKQLVVVGFFIFVFALFFGILFTVRKSQKNKLAIWTSATKKLLLNLTIPLFVGGVFCLALIHHHLFVLVAPSTLVFYGLALINAEKYTLSDIKYLGIFQALLGCIALFFLGSGFLFWMIGFGVLHVLYGLILYNKYK